MFVLNSGPVVNGQIFSNSSINISTPSSVGGDGSVFNPPTINEGNETSLEEVVPIKDVWMFFLIFVFIITMFVFFGSKSNQAKLRKVQSEVKAWFVIATKRKKK